VRRRSVALKVVEVRPGNTLGKSAYQCWRRALLGGVPRVVPGLGTAFRKRPVCHEQRKKADSQLKWQSGPNKQTNKGLPPSSSPKYQRQPTCGHPEQPPRFFVCLFVTDWPPVAPLSLNRPSVVPLLSPRKLSSKPKRTLCSQAVRSLCVPSRVFLVRVRVCVCARVPLLGGLLKSRPVFTLCYRSPLVGGVPSLVPGLVYRFS
jgi:hypothetical protein